MSLNAVSLPDFCTGGAGRSGDSSEVNAGEDDAASRRADTGPPLPGERRLDMCEGVIDICAALFSVSGRDLRQTGRSVSEISRVRQIAMYVAHTQLGLTMREVGRGFGRDRTTVLYACHLIEDLRDDEDFDRILSTTERITRAAFRATGMI